MPKGAGRKPAKGAGKARAAPRKKLSAQELYLQAQVALQFDDCESALSSLQQAVALEPRNLEIVEAYGSLLAEMGDMEQAIAMLRRAVEISPDAGHEKYMYLGQLLEGEEALGMMRRGIELLQVTVDQAVAAEAEGGEGVEAGSKGAGRAGEGEEMEDAGEEEEEEDDDPPPTAEELQEQLCSALCSLAESLMNQADDVEGVAGEVEGLLARAKATCSSSPEPGQALASLRYEQQRPAEAVEVLRESMQLWFKRRSEEDEEGEEGEGDEDMGEGAGAGGKKGGKGKKGSAEEEGDSEDELGEAAAARQRRGAAGAAGSSGDGMEEDEDEDDDEEGILPSYEFRFECAKLLLELDESTEDAIQVLEDLVEEDDSNPHTWHLLGMAYYGGHMLDEAQEIHDKGMKLLKKLKVPDNDELYDDYADLQDAIQTARTALQA